MSQPFEAGSYSQAAIAARGPRAPRPAEISENGLVVGSVDVDA
jgi:hypothetical protein